MKQEKHVPKRRFRAFAEEWNETPFDEVFDTSVPTNTFARDDLNDVAGTVRNIHYGDVLIKYSAIVDAQKEEIPYLNEGISIITDERQYLQNGDVVMADTAEDETAGKVVELENAEEHSMIAGLHTMVLRPTFPFGAKFLGYKLNAPSYHEQLIPLMQGTKVTSVNKQALSETNIAYPSNLAEQERIGEFLYRLDALLSIHERKLQKLEHLKQAYLAEMFPAKGERQPRRRFKGFSGDWDGKTLGELLAFSNGFNGSREMYGHGIKYISVMDILNNDYIVYDNIRGQVDVSEETAKTFAVTYGDVLFQRSSETFDEAGTSNVYVDADRPAVFGGFVICGTKVEEYDPFFMKHLLDTKPVRHQIISTAQGAQHINVGQESLSHVQIFLPSMDEQQKIGAFFRIMDKKLQSEQQKLAKLRALKQAYLSELFV